MSLNHRSENPIRLQQVQYWIRWLSAGFASGKWDSVYLGRGYDFAGIAPFTDDPDRSEEHTSELQSQSNLVCRLLLEKKRESNHTMHALTLCASVATGPSERH